MGDLFAWVCGRILPWSCFLFVEFEDFGTPQRPRIEIPRFWAYSETLHANMCRLNSFVYLSVWGFSNKMFDPVWTGL